MCPDAGWKLQPRRVRGRANPLSTRPRPSLPVLCAGILIKETDRLSLQQTLSSKLTSWPQALPGRPLGAEPAGMLGAVLAPSIGAGLGGPASPTLVSEPPRPFAVLAGGAGPAGLGTRWSEAGGGVAASPGGFVLEMGRGPRCAFGGGEWGETLRAARPGTFRLRLGRVSWNCGFSFEGGEIRYSGPDN